MTGQPKHYKPEIESLPVTQSDIGTHVEFRKNGRTGVIVDIKGQFLKVIDLDSGANGMIHGSEVWRT